MPTLVALLESTRVSAIAWLHVFVLLTWIEFAFPRERHSFQRRLTNLSFWAVTIPVTIASSAYLGLVWRSLGIEPIVNVPLDFAWMGPLSYVFAAIVAAIVGDFFLYWFHRAQHAWLWRFHAVHHSIKELNAVNSYAHITESTFQNLFVVIPTSLFVVDVGPILPYLVIIMRLHPIFIHSPVKLHFGFLRCIFVDNRIHRIHHSIEEHHFDKNFGVFTTLWDRLFGTAYFPSRDEWPATGILEADEPRTVGEWLLMPWRLNQTTGQAGAGKEGTVTQAADAVLELRPVGADRCPMLPAPVSAGAILPRA